jgi:hypothetical protein
MTTRFELAALAFAILGLVAILAVLVVWWGRGEAGDGGSGAADGPRSDFEGASGAAHPSGQSEGQQIAKGDNS